MRSFFVYRKRLKFAKSAETAMKWALQVCFRFADDKNHRIFGTA